MDKKSLWEQFATTGSIESYMQYKGLSGSTMENEAEGNDENAGIDH